MKPSELMKGEEKRRWQSRHEAEGSGLATTTRQPAHLGEDRTGRLQRTGGKRGRPRRATAARKDALQRRPGPADKGGVATPPRRNL